ncbi:glucuronate isomerase [Saliterribacillus persicus]|uniref:Uronate isomerase n=1 Tax=Saliterribacillus persicus TaxID=930114 RepID=A0A368Y3M4_9BACI|nr:glucuronate isomerase [Saliterribacillus persicus]RCW74900.1 D-glucuronate isomerase [Saliterribacillus persicus]
MKTFMTEDFLLYNETAKRLYHETAKDLPIIDYHNHLPPEEIYADKKYQNIYEIWLSGDHYKWRAMRANGIAEDYITGNQDPYKKFEAWAKTVPNTFGNPLYHWTHSELLRYFQIDELLNAESAPRIWDQTKETLQNRLSVRAILEQDKVEFVGTTDDPTDDLIYHKKLKEEGYQVKVSPSFRPDNALQIEKDTFKGWVDKLSGVVNQEIRNYDAFLMAMENRIEYFNELGCKSADHGINVMFFEVTTKNEVASIFIKKLEDQPLTEVEINKFKTYTLLQLGEWYTEKGWVMQLHMGPRRNNNTEMFQQVGPDSGFDSPGDRLIADPLNNFLDALDQTGSLPKTILYTLNARDNEILAATAGNFQNAEVPGKIQFGTAWWFNDHIDGMENQMKTLANFGLIRHFIGMLTDSRSFLSFSRHEYFRRIACNLIGSWAEEGKVPKDMPLLKQYVADICYHNAKRYFNI